MGSGDMTTFHGRFLGYLVYILNRTTTFVRAFNVPTHLE